MESTPRPDRPVLIGNSFPLSLIRRPVRIEPRPIHELITLIHQRGLASFWGHENTVAAASTILCADLRTKAARPALALSDDGSPVFEGTTFNECWILSPDYAPGFRPEIGIEVSPDKILDWQALRIRWEVQR